MSLWSPIDFKGAQGNCRSTTSRPECNVSGKLTRALVIFYRVLNAGGSLPAQGKRPLHGIGMSALLLSLLSSCLIFSVSRASAYICLSNGKQQKLSPSVEPGLRKCQQYSSNACCSSDHFHAEPVSPFPWDQCGPLSSRCEAQISKVECMYLCSPDIAAWHNPESNSGIKELPLCSEFCDQWFEACKDDLICSGNHAANANCSQDCISYRQAFAAGSQLCDEIWGNSFRTGNKPNPCIEPQSIGSALSHEEPVSEYPNTQEGPSENQPSLSSERVKRAMPEEVIAADLDNTLEGPSGLTEFPNIPARERLRRDIYVNPIAEDVDNSQEGPSGSTDLPNV
uniref:Folate receptor-like domain-containing protein n=1 Tax=Leptobrachium leishanense TaxID=445787 RepID=A0A8C5WEC3_9ANUR